MRISNSLARRLAAIVFLLISSPIAWGHTSLRATFGWGDSLRLGWWTPVYVTVMDDQTRPVILQVQGQHGLATGMIIRQHAVVQPKSTVYEVLYPLESTPSKITVSVLDEASGKTLAWQQLEDPIYLTNAGLQPHSLVGGGETLIGVSSSNGSSAELRAQWSTAEQASGFLRPDLLPANSVGYQGVAVLMLDAVNLQNLQAIQEQAMLDWVAAGGNLLIWPGNDPMPRSDAILAALPCDIGKNISVAMPALATSRPADMNGRELTSRPGAQAFQIFSSGASSTGYAKSVGLGRIAVLPVDLSHVQLNDAVAARTFWRGIFQGMIDMPEAKTPHWIGEGPEEDFLAAEHPRIQDTGGRQNVAMKELLTMMGMPPERGHDWGTMMLVVAALMFVAGPLDSVLLYRLGRPPRTWLTTLGWIGLLAAGIGYFSFRPKAQAAQIKTFSLIDQAGDANVAQSDLVEIISGRDQTCQMTLDPLEWWEPARPPRMMVNPGDRFEDVACLEDRQGARPERLKLDRGQAVTLRGIRIVAGKKLIEAALSLNTAAPGKARIVGTITNLSPAALTDVQIATSHGNCRIPREIPAGQTIHIDQLLTTSTDASAGLPGEAMDLAPIQTDRVNERVSQGHAACITAQSPGAAPIQVIDGMEAQEHWQVIRMLADLN